MTYRCIYISLAVVALLLVAGPTAAQLSLAALPLGMVSLLDEQRFTVAELARREQVNPSTVWRWVLRGVRGIRLESFKVAGRRYTTLQAFERWVEATNERDPVATTPVRTHRQREQAIKQAEDELEREGI